MTKWKYKYHKYLQSEQWKNIRDEVIKSANGRCKCGSLATQVHHKTYQNIFHEVLDDLVAICKSCHENIHQLNNHPSSYQLSIREINIYSIALRRAIIRKFSSCGKIISPEDVEDLIQDKKGRRY